MPYNYPIKFGKYFLTRRIAVGGMAEVFKAKLVGIKGFEKNLAVKKILPEYSEDEEFLQMFVDEARISSHLHHFNIVQVFDFGEVESAFYIAMELVDGPNLKNLLQRCVRARGAFPQTVAIYILKQIARALEYAHKLRIDGSNVLNIVHRDVSPQNVLVSRSGDVKITDFGIAKAAIRLSHTQPGKIQGKFSYMSPEQAAGRPVDYRSDIFSLGIIGYELLTGIKVYSQEDTQKRYAEVREAKIPDLSTLVEKIPAPLESLIMSMLAKDVKDRPQSCGEIVNGLNEFLGDKSTEDLRGDISNLIEDLFPKETSDAKIEKKLQNMKDGDEVVGEPVTEVDLWRSEIPEDHHTKNITKAIGQEVTVTGIEVKPRYRRGRTRPFWLALFLFTLLVAGLYWFVESEQNIIRRSRSRGLPPSALNESGGNFESPSPSGPVDMDLLKAVQAREEELEAAAREAELKRIEAEQQRSEAERIAKEAQQALKEVEQELENVAVAPAEPCPKGMVLISAGNFLFGADPDDPDRNHLVEPDATNLRLQQFCIDPYEFPNRKGKKPKVGLTWTQAQAACSENMKRLCTQEEWERACKGPMKRARNRRYPYGNQWEPDRCNTETRARESGDDPDRPLKESGAFSQCKGLEGVFDMSGNADEWTASPGHKPGTRVTRGGSSLRPGWASRCTSVRWLDETSKMTDVGFRCCKDAR